MLLKQLLRHQVLGLKRANAARENVGLSNIIGVSSKLTGMQYTPSITVSIAGYVVKYAVTQRAIMTIYRQRLNLAQLLLSLS